MSLPRLLLAGLRPTGSNDRKKYMTQPKILIVDDEPFNVDYLEQELEELDYNIITAFNGRDALDQVRNEKPDLILLDIMMSVMDGFAVLGELKADPLLRSIFVIVISAVNDLESVVKGIQLVLQRKVDNEKTEWFVNRRHGIFLQSPSQ